MNSRTLVRITATIVMPLVLVAMIFYGIYKLLTAGLELLVAALDDAGELAGYAYQKLFHR